MIMESPFYRVLKEKKHIYAQKMYNPVSCFMRCTCSVYTYHVHLLTQGSVLGKKTKKIVDNSLWQASMVTHA